MKKRQFVILILLLIIGFASVTTTLVLNGKVGVGVELDDFDVIFIEALLDGKEDIKTSISEDKKTITFSTERLSNKGESARLDYKVKNTSTQYNADVEINCTNEANEYVNVTSSFDGNQIPLISPINIKAQEVKSGYINAELIKAYAGEDTSIEIKCTINVTATSRETYAYSLMFNSNGGSSIDDKSVVLNEEYGELEEPVREGYTFLGWYDEEDNKVDETTIFDSKGNRNLKAKWEVNEYPVTIKTNEHGNSESDLINVEYEGSTNLKITPDQNYYISSIECTEGYTVENYNEKIPQYGEQSIIIRNNKVTKEGTCTFSFSQGIFKYGYTGGEQTFSPPLNGEYKIELWGAGTNNTIEKAAYGGYVSGKTMLSNDNLYVYIGGQGRKATTSVGNTGGGYNGGGNGGYYSNGSTFKDYQYGGAGATDIRLVNGTWNNFESLKSRIIVAGGAASGNTHSAGGLSSYGYYPLYPPATQTSGHAFGYGCFKSDGSTRGGGGSGGGYYGGNCAANGATSAGGSSFISGHNGCDAIAESSMQSKIVHTGQPNHYSGYVFTDTVMIDGEGYKWTNVKGSYTGMPTHDGKSIMKGNLGNGYAKITLVTIK